jgi:CheY-like chemotaxis protein
MARIVALVPDLLFGSRVQSALTAAGHDVTLAADLDALASEVAGVDAVVADLASGEVDPAALAATLPQPAPPVLACYAHVEPDARERALAAGLDVVVPRSRLNREGAALLDSLLAQRGA